jgi:Astacin (Peptidase family M12A)
MIRSVAAVAVLASSMSALSISTPSAHDIGGLANKSIALSNELNVSALTKLANQQREPGARYVFSRLLLWTIGQQLKACFYEGTADEKDAVVQAVHKLLDGKGVNIGIDFGAATSYRPCDGPGASGGDLRISFSRGCCAAYIGRTALAPDVKGGPSIFLQGVTKYDPDIAQQTIMHEVMHALGFNHEHQSQQSPCKFKKDEIEAAYGWSDQQYETNLKQLEQSSRSYTWSSYDPTSIMKYYFKPEYLVDGEQSKCYSTNNLLPSSRDYDGLKLAYPQAPPPISKQQTREALDVIAASQAPAQVKALARELRKLE